MTAIEAWHLLRTTVKIVSREGLETIGDIVGVLTAAEGLHAHARSVRIRWQK